MLTDFINPIDRDALRETFQNAKPVPWFKIDNFFKADVAEQCYSAFPTYDQVQKVGQTFTNVNEKGKFQVTDSNLFPAPLKAVSEFLNGREFLELIEYVTGMPDLEGDPQFVGGGLHSTGARGHLDVHLDFNYMKERQLHRRLNILVYMNKDWKPEWGGEFELWDPEVKTLVQKFSPVFNRCVMFNTNEISYHGVNAVKCPDGQSRKSFAAYYYTKEAPAGWDGTIHSTIFRARPDEKLKSVLMPMENASHAVSKFLHRGAHKLKKAVTGS
jgi:hypothetical protein